MPRAYEKDPLNLRNPFVFIGVSLGGIYMIIVLFFLLFAREFTAWLVPIAWSFVMMALIASFFLYMSQRNRGR